MKIKTCRATHNQIDWLVATTLDGYSDWCAETETFRVSELSDQRKGLCWLNYSTDIAQAWPLIKSHRVCLDVGHDGLWLAYTKQNYEDEREFLQCDRDPLVAAMRTLIESLLGPNPDVPEGLK